jgi:hypothetical protein
MVTTRPLNQVLMDDSHRTIDRRLIRARQKPEKRASVDPGSLMPDTAARLLG